MRKTLAFLASAALMGLTLAAHADTYTYTFSNTGGAAGPYAFNFTDASLITKSTNLFTSPSVSGLTCSVNSVACTGLTITSVGSTYIGFNGQLLTFLVPSSFFLVGSHTSGSSTLTIVDNPSVAATPEPSSIVLLGTGLLGLAGAARRRFLKP